MLLTLTEDGTNNTLFINSEYVVAVFTSMQEESKGKTIVALINGSVVVTQKDYEIAGMIKGVN